MENAYGVGITNRYQCFLDNDEDPSESIKAPEQAIDKDAAKKHQVKPKAAEKENRSGKEAEAPQMQRNPRSAGTPPDNRKGIRDSNKGQEANKKDNKGTVEKPGEGGNYQRKSGRNSDPPKTDRSVKFSDDEREERNNRRNRDDAIWDPQHGESGRRGRGGSFPRGGRTGAPRPPRSFDGASRGGPARKREFDRQSGSDKSGVKAVDKREGGGSRNWGNYKDDIEGVEGERSSGPDDTIEDRPEPIEEDKKEEEKAPQPVPPEEKTMTLTEWKAVMQSRQKPVFNIRKAGEGEDNTKWENMTRKTKETDKKAAGEALEPQPQVEEDEEQLEFDYPQRAGRQKMVLDIDFRFSDSRRGGGRFGGGGRGGRGDRRGQREGGPRERSERGDRGEGRGGQSGDRTDRPFDRPERFDRGGGERGGDRGFRNMRTPRGGGMSRENRQAAPKVDDVNDFPSLN